MGSSYSSCGSCGRHAAAVGHVQLGLAPEGSIFADLQTGEGCKIELTEERAISLAQLARLESHMRRRCTEEGWTGRRRSPGDPSDWAQVRLEPEVVNLYDLVNLVVIPATSARHQSGQGGSYVELVAAGPQRPRWFVSHFWGEPIVRFVACVKVHARDRKLDDDAAYWVCAYANNQHDVSGDVTADPEQSSFLKAIRLADGRVLSILDEHGTCYTRIWCVFEVFQARQGDGLYDMYTAVEDCTAYNPDTWTLAWDGAGKSGEFHIPGIKKRLGVEHRKAVGITDGCAETDGFGYAWMKALREAAFPHKLIGHAVTVELQKAEASEMSDKRTILNCIARRSLDSEPLAECSEYDELNSMVRGAFISAGWRRMLEAGEDMAPLGHMLAASRLRTLVLDLSHCAMFTDKAAQLLVTSLPPTLRVVDVIVHKRLSPSTMGVFYSEIAKGRPELRKLILGSCPYGEDGVGLLHGALAHSGAWAKLLTLNLIGCALKATIPCEIGQCTELTSFDWKSCKLTGRLPCEFGQCAAIESLVLGNNDITGDIPSSLGDMKSLFMLHLNDNRLSGSIPGSLAGCPMKNILLQRNGFTGEIPYSLAECPLEIFDASSNQLSGSIPQAFGGCATLQKLHVSDNRLTGVIPVELGQCTALVELDLQCNQLSGSIPSELGNCNALEVLLLNQNQLTGKIPEALGQCAPLQKLHVQDNLLTKEVPAALGSRAKLELRMDGDS